MTPARSRQLSLFGVEARPPTPMDLEGLLAGAGEVGRMGGTAKVSIEVEDAWRAQVLRAECEQRGLVVSSEPTGVEDRWTVRTAYAALLAPLAARWLAGTGKVCPADLVLDGRRLRLWVAAAGSWDGQRAYLLRLAPSRPHLPEEEAGDETPPIGEDEEQPEGAPPEPARAAQADVVGEVDDTPDEEPAEDVPEPPRGRAKKKTTSLISTFDPGPVDLDPAVEDWIDDSRDSWPDADLPTVELDPLAEPAPEPVDTPDDAGGTDENSIDRQVADNWVAVGDALAAVGLIAVFVGPKAGGPAYRIVGLRRVTRLAELVGEPPPEAPYESWPR
ncbi:hypothetical protein [Dactylosporangium aurantiacum]|uniref:hypothetical protein n=1 Tax=Dactylosporangium aurantiacum TaxID=35754 RepID=UPI0012DE7CA6|nr:hypothetical protein [Dactylosporangium aurantiacum]MDG6101019.1 hypothetical protein [Dactylosporangium aurantiacum]